MADKVLVKQQVLWNYKKLTYSYNIRISGAFNIILPFKSIKTRKASNSNAALGRKLSTQQAAGEYTILCLADIIILFCI